MTARQQQTVLRTELGNLTDLIAGYGPARSTVENPFLEHLQATAAEKTEELNHLNTLVDTPRYRFWEECRKSRPLFWLSFGLSLFSLPMLSAIHMPAALFLGVGFAALFLGLGIWSENEPK